MNSPFLIEICKKVECGEKNEEITEKISEDQK
jgi:hypothetical protein